MITAVFVHTAKLRGLMSATPELVEICLGFAVIYVYHIVHVKEVLRRLWKPEAFRSYMTFINYKIVGTLHYALLYVIKHHFADDILQNVYTITTCLCVKGVETKVVK